LFQKNRDLFRMIGGLNHVTKSERDNKSMAVANSAERQSIVTRGQRLQYITIAYNCAEALVSLIAGWLAGSVSLIGFGFDSLIEVTSGAAVLWRLHHDMDANRRQQLERSTLRIVGGCFLALALYILYESVETLVSHRAPERSLPGIAIAGLSVVLMPVLARAKRRVAQEIDSAAMKADSRQTDFCAYLSAIVLAGLVLHALFGWWWADPAAALLMVPIIAREGTSAVRGRSCCDTCNCR
jgi:divalent metal cation (Fe/Co/Zn/Cd) transporter